MSKTYQSGTSKKRECMDRHKARREKIEARKAIATVSIRVPR